MQQQQKKINKRFLINLFLKQIKYNKFIFNKIIITLKIKKILLINNKLIVIIVYYVCL